MAKLEKIYFQHDGNNNKYNQLNINQFIIQLKFHMYIIQNDCKHLNLTGGSVVIREINSNVHRHMESRIFRSIQSIQRHMGRHQSKQSRQLDGKLRCRQHMECSRRIERQQRPRWRKEQAKKEYIQITQKQFFSSNNYFKVCTAKNFDIQNK